MSMARFYRVGSPYNGVELDEVDYEQSADTMYLAHLDHAPTKLLRYGHTDWRFVGITFGPTISAPTGVTASATTPNTDDENDGAAFFPQPATYAVTALNEATGQESRASDGSTVSNDLTLKRNYNSLTWAAVEGATAYQVYRADNQLNYGYVGTTRGTSFTDDNIGPDLTRGPPQGSNPFAAAGDWPSTVAFFEQRLMWARTRNAPNAVFGSKSGQANYENHDAASPLKDSDALSLAIVSGRVNAVNQLVSLSSLLALTTDAIFNISGSGSDALTPTQINARRQIGRGSSRLNPLIVDNVVFYRPSTGNAVRALNYSFEADGFKSDDVSIFSPHFFDGFTIKSWAYAQEPNSLIWAVRNDGKLLCFTWEQEQQVWGWTLCETDGEVDSVCSISENGEDRLYLTVWRMIGGVRKLYIERMASARWATIGEACFVDSGKTYQFDEPTTLILGLEHLEGRTVIALVDGSVIENMVVQGGRLTLPTPGLLVTIGLPYTALIETLPLSIGADGTNIGKKQHVGEIVIRCVDTRGVLAGANEKNLFEIKPRGNESYGSPNRLMNGDYTLDSAPVAAEQSVAVLKMPYPLPATITGILLDPTVTG
ncbi:hypothetical protein [Sphingomonas sp.]|uniref:hypothetical protein n=1 Tax=Sphingomonas sp. TaxID=28214 RepID=UPI0035C83463